jgi:putative transposase
VPYRLVPFQTNYFYHVFNRGVEKRQIFSSPRDYERFLQTIYYYQFSGPKPKLSTYKRFKFKEFYSNPKIVEIICYCLMPNHFHFLLKQIKENGIREFMSKLSNSYTKYFNTKHNRVGPLWQGQFKAVSVETGEQLVHLSRYIHLNPVVARLTKNLDSFEYSSYKDFVGLGNDSFCFPDPILGFFTDKNSYCNFVKDQEAYAIELANIKHLLIEDI